MEQTLQALAGILLKSIPTIVLVLILHFYLKRMLFAPLDRVLKQRDDATAGARKAAEESLARAEQRATEFDNAIRDARSDVYREQEQARKEAVEQQEARLKESRTRVEAMIAEAKARIQAEADAARRTLENSAGELADQITSAVLVRRVS